MRGGHYHLVHWLLVDQRLLGTLPHLADDLVQLLELLAAVPQLLQILGVGGVGWDVVPVDLVGLISLERPGRIARLQRWDGRVYPGKPDDVEQGGLARKFVEGHWLWLPHKRIA